MAVVYIEDPRNVLQVTNLCCFLFLFTVFSSDHIETIIPEDLLDKQDLPRIVIISVSVIGVFLLIVNIGLVAGCVLKRRAKKIRGLSIATARHLKSMSLINCY